jgi:hypothetical protein
LEKFSYITVATAPLPASCGTVWTRRKSDSQFDFGRAETHVPAQIPAPTAKTGTLMKNNTWVRSFAGLCDDKNQVRDGQYQLAKPLLLLGRRVEKRASTSF